ncbi:MAG TPA: hypothetical protein VKQ72_00545 [Aggregatilineales bacterium]|nr:hypothetical protein [Aggregatilineales bacterium]
MDKAVSRDTQLVQVAQAVGKADLPDAFEIARDVSLIWIERRGIAPARDLLGRVFVALGQVGVPVLLISHSSWQGNCCFVVPAIHCLAALDALHSELEADFERGDVSRLSARNDVILLSAGPQGTTGHPGGSSRILESLARHEINILVTAHAVMTGSLSLIIASQDEGAALSALCGKSNPVPKASGHEWADSPKVSLSAAI